MIPWCAKYGICCYVRSRTLNVICISFEKHAGSCTPSMRNTLVDVSKLRLLLCGSPGCMPIKGEEGRDRKGIMNSRLGPTLSPSIIVTIDFRASNVDNFVWKCDDVGSFTNGLHLGCCFWHGLRFQLLAYAHVCFCDSVLHPGIIAQEWANN